MNERMIRFIELLNQMFELDKSDLDFGIYRILNIRRKEIQKFFTEGLPTQIRETFRGHKTKRIFKREPENDGRT